MKLSALLRHRRGGKRAGFRRFVRFAVLGTLAVLVVLVAAAGHMPVGEKLVAMYGLCALALEVPSIVSFGLALGLTTAILVFSVTPLGKLSEALAVYVFYLLATGVASALLELKTQPDRAVQSVVSRRAAAVPVLRAAQDVARPRGRRPKGMSDLSMRGTAVAEGGPGMTVAGSDRGAEGPGRRGRGKQAAGVAVAVSKATAVPAPDVAEATEFSGRRNRAALIYRIVVFPLLVMGISASLLLEGGPYLQPYIDSIVQGGARTYDLRKFTVSKRPATPNVSPTPQAALAVKSRSQQEVMVENGSGVAGVAQKVAGRLTEQGYVLGAKDISNADRFDYGLMEIHCRPGAAGGAREMAAALGQNRYKVVEDLGVASQYDFVVIAGRAQ